MTENNRLPEETGIAQVHLRVSNLQSSLDYYQRSLGFQIHKIGTHTAQLGAGKDNLLVLTEIPEAVRAPRHTGLYHFAILLPSRLELAKTLQHLKDSGTRIDGASDHLVSEALYLSDPDGNGIEIYRDRPKSEWSFNGEKIRMVVDPLDSDGILAELGENQVEWHGLPAETRIGHMHLRVARIQEAEEFYIRVIGFDLMARYGSSASFLSAGGYHHHLGINTWESLNAPPPPTNAVGMESYSIELPDEERQAEVRQRVDSAGIEHEMSDGRLSVQDPSGNQIQFIIRVNENSQ